VGKMRFSLRVSGEYKRKTKWMQVHVTLSAEPVLGGNLKRSPAMTVPERTGEARIGTEMVGYNLKMNPDDKLILTTSYAVSPANAIDDPTATQMTVTYSELLNKAADGSDITANNLDASKSNLVLKDLQAGSLFTFRATFETNPVQLGSAYGSSTKVFTTTSDYNVFINQKPSGGSCTVSCLENCDVSCRPDDPCSKGRSLTTVFQMDCVRWVDDDPNAQLKYSFGFVGADGQPTFDINQETSYSSTFTPGKSGTIVAVARIYDEDGAYTEERKALVITDTITCDTPVADQILVFLPQLEKAKLSGDVNKQTSWTKALAEAKNKQCPTRRSVGGRRLLSSSAVNVTYSLLTSLYGTLQSSPPLTVADAVTQAAALVPLTEVASSLSEASIGVAMSSLDQLVAKVKGEALGSPASFMTATNQLRSAVNSQIAADASRSATLTPFIDQVIRSEFDVANAALKSASPGEAPTTLLSDAKRALTAQRVSRNAFTGALGIGTVGVNASFGFTGALLAKIPATGDEVATGGLSHAIDLIMGAVYDCPSTAQGFTFRSKCFSLRIARAMDTEEFPLSGLSPEESVTIRFPVDISDGMGTGCVSNNGTSPWIADGMSLVSASSKEVVCSSTHLTQFSIVQTAPPPTNEAKCTTCVCGNQTYSQNATLDVKSMLPARGEVVFPNANLTLVFNRPIQVGSGSITLTPTSGAPVVIPVHSSQVTISGNTLRVTPNMLPSTSPFTTYAVSYSAGLVNSTDGSALLSQPCCAKQLVEAHVQTANNRTEYYYGQADLSADFKLEFDITLHTISSSKMKIFAIGDEYRGPVVSQQPGQSTLSVRLGTISHAGVGGDDLGDPMHLGVEYHWEIQMQGQVLTIRRNHSNVFCHDLGAAKFAEANLPLTVGADSGDFTLRNVMLGHSTYSFQVADTGAPSIVAYSPKAGDTVTIDTNFSFTFDRIVRPGSGSIVFERPSGNTRSFSVHDSQISFSGETLLLNPSSDPEDSASNVITMDSGAVMSSGSWQQLLRNYMPVTATQLQCLAALPTRSTLDCYMSCRSQSACVAFKIATVGASHGECCLYSAYSLHGPAASHGVQAAQGFTFNRLSTADVGNSFGGIAGPTSKLEGSLTLNGLSQTELQGSPQLQEAVTTTIATEASTTGATIDKSQVQLAFPSSTTTRRLLSTSVTYTITLSAAQASAAPAAAAAIVASLTSANGAFVTQLKSNAQSLGVLTQAMTQFLTASGTTPSVTVSSSQFSFSTEDTSGPQIIAYLPERNSVIDDPGTAITLTFNEDIMVGHGSIRFSHENGLQRIIPIISGDVRFSGRNLVVELKEWFGAGKVTVTLDAGAVTDQLSPSPGGGPMATRPHAGIAQGSYEFTVVPKPRPPKQTTYYLQIGVSPGTQGCSYMMTHPWYSCQDMKQCTIFVKAMSSACRDGPPVVFRKITFDALQHIAKQGFERNGGDGRDSMLSYGGGRPWPEYGISDFAYADHGEEA